MTFIIIIISLIIGYWVFNSIMHTIPEVEAGPIGGLTSTGFRRLPEKVSPSFKKKDANGVSTIYRSFFVRGKCMEQVNIQDGSIVKVKVLTKSDRKNIQNVLQPEHVALIYLNDKNFHGYKLRIIQEVRESDALTYYYRSNEQVASSKPHELKDIIGIVENY